MIMSISGIEVHIASSLRAMKPDLRTSFAETISLFAIKRVEAIAEDIEFLCTDDPREMNEKDVLFDIQFWDFFEEYLSAKEKTGDKVEITDWDALYKELHKDWVPKYRRTPTAGWLRRARNIVDGASPVAVLRRFQSLKEEMEKFGDTVSKAARALDEHIQLQIDIARGK
jgi:hypothetical protein